MAEIFQHISNHPDNPQKVFNIAGKTQEEAMKYLRYLHRNALFGTHTGLPKSVRNQKINESLVSNIGDYSVLDVYAYPQTKCIIGTVVNFYISNDVNPLGSTYVYPCTDRDKPMGYMISDATSEELGVCLVHGVLEVPLYYFSGSTEEKKDFVEYDIENACFKFSDFGYPVFNVYQDVDGDWIAIILFGNKGTKYDGQFSVFVSGITGGTTYVDILGGDVLFNDIRGVCPDLEEPIALATGESIWLETTIVGNTNSYSFKSLSTVPIDGSTVFNTKIAENNNGKIRQIHYGDIYYSRTKLISGSTNVHIYPVNGLGDVVISVDSSGGGGGSEFYTPPYASLAITGSTIPEGRIGHTFVYPVKAGTVGFFDDGGDARAVWTDVNGTNTQPLTNKNLYSATSDGWIRVSVIDGGTASGACLSIQDSTGNLPIYKYGYFGDKNIDYLEGTGISITGQTDSTTGLFTGNKIINVNTSFSISVDSSNNATISLAGSTNNVILKSGSGISITQDETNSIIISATGGGGAGIVTGITSSISGTTATISTIGGIGNVKFYGVGGTTISSGENGEIVIGSTTGGGGGGGEVGYSILATGGTTSTRLQKDTNYILWVKQAPDTLEEATYAYLRTTYSNLDLGSSIGGSDGARAVLELPNLGNSSDYCFISLDLQINPMNTIIIDTELKGIAYGNPLFLQSDGGGTFIRDNAYFNNAYLIGENNKFMLMYDPIGVSVDSDRNIKAHWFIWKL